jgi:hypothetical protein
MKRMNVVGTLVAAAFVIGLIGAASAMAHATNNPQWQILGTVLKAGETVKVHAEANGVQTLSSVGLSIECTKFGLLPGAILVGSNAPAPGTSEEIIQYSECKVKSSPLCKINGAVPGKIETKPLIDLLVFLTKLGALDENALESGTLFEPKTGEKFAEFELSEANPGTKECPATGNTLVEGKGVLVNNLNADELSTVKEIEAPATAKTKYFVNEPGLVVKEKTGVNIKIGGIAATYTGNARILLASKEHWGIFN